MNYLSLLSVLAPELGLVLLAFAILAIDLVGLRRRSIELRSKWLGAGTAIGLVIAGLAISSRIGQGDPKAAYLLGGTLVVDDLALFFKVVVLALSVLTVLISM